MCWTEYIGLVGMDNSGKIENCYVYIKEIIEYPGYGEGLALRNGITYRNYAGAEILNCYYNCDIYSEEWGFITDLDNLPASYNNGIIENTCSYINKDSYWKLSESIVFNENSTDNLLEALNFGVEGLAQNGYECEYWCETSMIFDNLGLPIVCKFSEITSMDENLMDSDLNVIYPNPANDNITVKADDITQIEIYNTVGQMVERVDANEDSVEINVSEYNSGNYLMKITLNNGQSFTEKVVVR